jgi:hypothetical protein
MLQHTDTSPRNSYLAIRWDALTATRNGPKIRVEQDVKKCQSSRNARPLKMKALYSCRNVGNELLADVAYITEALNHQDHYVHTNLNLKTYYSHQKLTHFGRCVITLATLCTLNAYVWSVRQDSNDLNILSYGTQRRGSSMNTGAPDTTTSPAFHLSSLLPIIAGNRFLVNYELHFPP